MNTERLNEELAQHVEDAAHAAMLKGKKADEAIATAESHLGDRAAITLAAERVFTWHTIKQLKLEFILAMLLQTTVYSALYSMIFQPTYSPVPTFVAFAICYLLQRITLTPLRLHRPTYLLAAFLPIIAMFTIGITKDIVEVLATPYDTNTIMFVRNMIELAIVATLTLIVQNVNRERAKRWLSIAPAAYFLGTIVTLALDPNRMNSLNDISFLYLPRILIDGIFLSIVAIGRPLSPERMFFEVTAIGLAASILIAATWKVVRIYRKEHRVSMIEFNLICYLISFFAMLSLVY